MGLLQVRVIGLGPSNSMAEAELKQRALKGRGTAFMAGKVFF